MVFVLWRTTRGLNPGVLVAITSPPGMIMSVVCRVPSVRGTIPAVSVRDGPLTLGNRLHFGVKLKKPRDAGVQPTLLIGCSNLPRKICPILLLDRWNGPVLLWTVPLVPGNVSVLRDAFVMTGLHHQIDFLVAPCTVMGLGFLPSEKHPSLLSP